MKIAHFNHQNKQKALNGFLSSFRSIPHPSTGEAPGDLLFRGGYRSDFPRHTLTEYQVEQARKQDNDLRKGYQQALNESTHRKSSDLPLGSSVIVRNNQRRKFDPLFGPDVYTVIHTISNGLLLERHKDGQIFRRHCDDVKPINVDASEQANPQVGDKPFGFGKVTETLLLNTQIMLLRKSG